MSENHQPDNHRHQLTTDGLLSPTNIPPPTRKRTHSPDPSDTSLSKKRSVQDIRHTTTPPHPNESPGDDVLPTTTAGPVLAPIQTTTHIPDEAPILEQPQMELPSPDILEPPIDVSPWRRQEGEGLVPLPPIQSPDEIPGHQQQQQQQQQGVESSTRTEETIQDDAGVEQAENVQEEGEGERPPFACLNCNLLERERRKLQEEREGQDEELRGLEAECEDQDRTIEQLRKENEELRAKYERLRKQTEKMVSLGTELRYRVDVSTFCDAGTGKEKGDEEKESFHFKELRRANKFIRKLKSEGWGEFSEYEVAPRTGFARLERRGGSWDERCKSAEIVEMPTAAVLEYPIANGRGVLNREPIERLMYWDYEMSDFEDSEESEEEEEEEDEELVEEEDNDDDVVEVTGSSTTTSTAFQNAQRAGNVIIID